MNSIVIYGSRHGNTQRVAEEIATGLRRRGQVQLVAADEASSAIATDTDLVVIGGSTEAHRLTEPIALYFDRVNRGALKGKFAAAFDTRLRWPAWLSGSAGACIAERLSRAGAQVIAPEVSFFVAGRLPVLVSGELERAAAWGAWLADTVEARAPVAVAG